MMNDSPRSGQAGPPKPPGLCGDCRHAQVVVSSRGSRFLLCRYAAIDPRYPRYPTLPVLRCAAFSGEG